MFGIREHCSDTRVVQFGSGCNFTDRDVKMTKTLWKKYPKNDATVKPFLDRFTDFINLFYDFLGAEFNYFHIFISIIFPNLKLLWQSFHFILAVSHFCDQIKDFNLGFCLVKSSLMWISGIPRQPVSLFIVKITLIDMLLFIAVMTQLR